MNCTATNPGPQWNTLLLLFLNTFLAFLTFLINVLQSIRFGHFSVKCSKCCDFSADIDDDHNIVIKEPQVIK